MLRRLVIGGALALALVTTEATALATSADAQMLKGRTSQGHRIKIAATKHAFRIHVFEIDLRCHDGSALLLEEGGFLWTKTKSNGSFRESQFGKTDSVYFRGRLSNGRIRGRLRVTDKEKRAPMCASRWIAFSATPG
ncbi:MAG TPA: hypothetical protein VG816_08020 [Solirubrobacterales bacterium]|nr:hypothetical protein [Solirubrobacterales bacterium]